MMAYTAEYVRRPCCVWRLREVVSEVTRKPEQSRTGDPQIKGPAIRTFDKREKPYTPALRPQRSTALYRSPHSGNAHTAPQPTAMALSLFGGPLMSDFPFGRGWATRDPMDFGALLPSLGAVSPVMSAHPM